MAPDNCHCQRGRGAGGEPAASTCPPPRPAKLVGDITHTEQSSAEALRLPHQQITGRKTYPANSVPHGLEIWNVISSPLLKVCEHTRRGQRHVRATSFATARPLATPRRIPTRPVANGKGCSLLESVAASNRGTDGDWRSAAGGGWWLAIGGWWRLVVGDWWLVAVGGWRLAVGGGWQRLAVGQTVTHTLTERRDILT